MSRPLYAFDDHSDFIYSCEVFGDYIISGSGNGEIIVHNHKSGELCYTLNGKSNNNKSIQNAVRCISLLHTNNNTVNSKPKLVVAGDDGNVNIFQYENQF